MEGAGCANDEGSVSAAKGGNTSRMKVAGDIGKHKRRRGGRADLSLDAEEKSAGAGSK